MRDALRRAGLVLAGAVVTTPFALGAAASEKETDPDVVWRFSDPDIVESSGLVVGDNLVLTTNDSGDSGRVFAVDRRTGDTVGVTTWADEPDDVEALAPAGDGEVWVADIGDNELGRADIEVTRVPVGRGDRTVSRPGFTLRYPDGSTDAEALVAHPVTGRLYVVSKTILGGTVYAAPKRLDPAQTNPLRELDTIRGLVTDAAFFPDGRHIIVRGYAGASVYTFPDLGLVGDLELPDQQQGEGVAVSPEGTVFVSSEGLRSPLLRVALPAGVRRGMRSPEAETPRVERSPDMAERPAGGDGDDGVSPVPWAAVGAGAAVLAALLAWRARRER